MIVLDEITDVVVTVVYFHDAVAVKEVLVRDLGGHVHPYFY